MIVLPSCEMWKMEYGKWNHHKPLTFDLLTAGVFSNVGVIKNNFISKLVLRGGLQFAALPGVTIKDFSTKQFIKKYFIFCFNLSELFSDKQTPFSTDCLSYWCMRARKHRSQTPGPVRDPSLRINCGKAPLEVTQH